ncbi:MAG TPA: metallophosphoesterase, partial [Kofleriaceae bacterium]|nr:metallophosphoesterase [Kofleriaceae bacterium]
MARGKNVSPPVVSEHELPVAGLDARLDGVRIAQLSDIHVGSMTPREHVRAAVELANDAKPDVIVLTGDYVCWRRHEVTELEDQLAGLRARRVVAVLGNHDYFTWGRGVTEVLEKHGYDVLKNQHTAIDLDGAPLYVVGVDDPVTRHHDLDAAFAGVPDTAGRIVLCHCPEEAPGLADRGADLVLSGHTHGGQIYVRGITDRIAKRMGRKFLSGFYDVGRTRLYVTPGVGFSGVTFRGGTGTAAEVAV